MLNPTVIVVIYAIKRTPTAWQNKDACKYSNPYYYRTPVWIIFIIVLNLRCGWAVAVFVMGTLARSVWQMTYSDKLKSKGMGMSSVSLQFDRQLVQ